MPVLYDAAFSNDASPQYVVVLNGHELDSEITRYVTSVEYESADGIADVASFTVVNPNHIFSDKKIFTAGNTMDIYFGYADGGIASGFLPKFIGRVQIVNPEYSFPEGGVPSIRVKGYSRDHIMMDNEPTTAKKQKSKEKFIDYNLEQSVVEAVRRKAKAYQFDDDILLIRPAFLEPKYLPHISGVSDYDYIQALARYNNAVFWVDYDLKKEKWVLHFVEPEYVGLTTGLSKYQEKDRKRTFIYDPSGLDSTLLSFNPEFFFREQKTMLKASFTDDNGKEQIVEVDFRDKQQTTDTLYNGHLDEKVKNIDQARDSIKISLKDFAIDVVPNKKFRSGKDLAAWAAEWFRKHNQDFVIGEGVVIGDPNLMARQVHTLEGMGPQFDGDYYISKARHILVPNQGYRTEFSGRKIIKGGEISIDFVVAE